LTATSDVVLPTSIFVHVTLYLYIKITLKEDSLTISQSLRNIQPSRRTQYCWNRTPGAIKFNRRPNQENFFDMQKFSSHDLPNNEFSETLTTQIDRPSSPTYSESAEAPLLAEEAEKEQIEEASDNSPAANEEKKSTFSSAEYKIAFSHFLVRCNSFYNLLQN
jgi:hypothetical protein